MDDLKEASWIAELILCTFKLECLTPNHKDSQQLSHKHFVILQFVDSIDFACRLIHVVENTVFVVLLILINGFFKVTGWELEVADILINLTESN